MKTNYDTISVEIESGEWIANLEIITSAGSPGDYYTPGEGPSWEIDSGTVQFFDEEGEKLLPEVHGLDKLTPQDMKFLDRDIDRQFANFQSDAEEYYSDYSDEDRHHYSL